MSKTAVPIKACMDKMLELLLFVDTKCKENNLEYWLDGGTLLGAVRHMGYIPWDDDVDICLMYNDYRKLSKILQEECKSHPSYFCFNSERPPTNWTDNFADVTILKDGVIPVKIDLIPVKAIPNSESSIATDISLVNLAQYFKKGNFKNQEDVLSEHKRFLPNSNKEFLLKKNEFYNYFLEEYLPEISAKKENLKFNYIFNDAMVSKTRGYYSFDTIFPLSTIDFEGHSLPCPKDIPTYLNSLYGENYMDIPPESQRISYAYNNYTHSLSKQQVLNRIQLHFYREYQLVVARKAKSKWKRFAKKLTTFLQLSGKSLVHGDIKFIFQYLKFSIRHFIS